ncbi:oxidoreductase [Niveispirillum cyanobacteriorum]|uniref:Oxidoreductase n=1 Tax=Niveispirillum cyanobacteriorum TaxID=1612173 RepID=A0A2K9N8V0_9PROT|nr:oxidoreductase [Niveispirillum cyanobacteriorum]AUN29514.1 oxidoreductase [Niveispirillum cyanobacteriorum]GGE63661.1 oxidoreductase [Niveispirillum cyanobacteriorum]
MATLRTALVGFGYAGQTFHAPLIAATAGLELACIVSSNAGKVRQYWGEDVAVTPDINVVLADSGIDLVVIATPNDTHADLTRRALLAGKHVVVDKPFTVTLDEARALAALEQQTGRVLSIFHNRRWDSDFLTLSRLIKDGTLGRVTQFESHFDRFRLVPRDRWRERAGVAGAGLWYDLGPHILDQALCLFGRPVDLLADIATQRPGCGAADYFHAILRYADGLRVILHGSMLTADNGLRFAVHGDSGSFVKHGLDSQEDMLKAGLVPGCDNWGWDPRPGQLTRIGADGTMTAAAHVGLPGDYRCYYAGVVDAIRGLQPNPVTVRQAITVMEMIEAGVQSALTEHIVKL